MQIQFSIIQKFFVQIQFPIKQTSLHTNIFSIYKQFLFVQIIQIIQTIFDYTEDSLLYKLLSVKQ